MTNIDLVADPAAVAPRRARWELWVSFAAALLAMLVIASVLVVLTTELRGGWVTDHQLAMDKANAIHKLLFRP